MGDITIILHGNKTINANLNDLNKINYFQQLFEDKNYEEIKEINLTNTILTYDNLIIILNFLKTDNQEINDYMNKIEQVSELNTAKMPLSLYNFLAQYNINEDKEYNKMVIERILKIKEEANYLQYDIFCDAIEYKWADNYRLMDKTILKEILLENVEEIYEENFKYLDDIYIKTLDYKYLIVIFNYYNVEEDEIDNFFNKNEINDVSIYNLIKTIKISNLFFKKILIKNIDEIIDELKYII